MIDFWQMCGIVHSGETVGYVGDCGSRWVEKEERRIIHENSGKWDWLLLEAKKEWERLCDLMNQMGVLTEVNMAAFAAYRQSYARWKEAQEHIDSEGSTFETDSF